MNRTTIAQLYADQATFGGQTVTVAGWARTIRAMNCDGDFYAGVNEDYPQFMLSGTDQHLSNWAS